MTNSSPEHLQAQIETLRRVLGMFADEVNWDGEHWDASIQPWKLAQKTLAAIDVEPANPPTQTQIKAVVEALLKIKNLCDFGEPFLKGVAELALTTAAKVDAETHWGFTMTRPAAAQVGEPVNTPIQTEEDSRTVHRPEYTATVYETAAAEVGEQPDVNRMIDNAGAKLYVLENENERLTALNSELATALNAVIESGALTSFYRSTRAKVIAALAKMKEGK